MTLLLPLLALAALGGVEVGSYGRVQVSTDLQGGQGDTADVVAHGSRLDEDPYLEVDLVLSHELEDGGLLEVVITPALQGAPFHYDGEWSADLAMRNLYARADGLWPVPVSLWAGSRMARGDDVHLLDFWPLDDLNTVGGGGAWSPGPWELAVHGGLNRLAAGGWQVQWEEVLDEADPTPETVLVLDRQRAVGAARLSREIGAGALTLRARVYGELHALPGGTRLEEEFQEVELPSDRGTLAGAQLSAWGWAHDSYVHLFLRRATGLAAWDELDLPASGLDIDRRAAGAVEWMAATAGNHESGRVGLLWGAYLRRFQDADAVDVDIDDRWEAVVAVRPQWFPGEHTALGLELSHQWLRPDGLSPRTREHLVPRVTKVSVLPAVQPRPGSLARPQLRLQYTWSWLSDDARLWFHELDERRRANHQHFVGIGAEWWLNSRSYR